MSKNEFNNIIAVDANDDYMNRIRENIPKHIMDFYYDLFMLCKKYNITISHEDGQGSFIIEDFNEENIKWIVNAQLNIN